jgi:hypothetical protein
VTRAEQETTAPISRDELLALLDAMDAPKPKRTAPFSQIAALLPASTRPKRPPPIVRARTAVELKAVQVVTEARARLDTAEQPVEERDASRERISFSGAPTEMRITLPEAPSWNAPPRIEITPLSEDAVAIHARGDDDDEEPTRVVARGSMPLAPIVASIVALAIALYLLL